MYKSQKSFYQKTYKPAETRPWLYPSYFGFLGILDAVSLNTSSEAVFLGKYLNLYKPCHVESKLYFVCFNKYTLNLLLFQIFELNSFFVFGKWPANTVCESKLS